MTDREIMQQALDALEDAHTRMEHYQDEKARERVITALTDRLAQPEQEPVAWKLMPRDATDSMLKAMDECSTEGYDERLYAGHAASVYMAAWDEAPTPPQRKIEQEPVALREALASALTSVYVCGRVWSAWGVGTMTEDDFSAASECDELLDELVSAVTTPPQRTWVGLTIEEIAGCCMESTTTQLSFAKNLEAKLKEKNA